MRWPPARQPDCNQGDAPNPQHARPVASQCTSNLEAPRSATQLAELTEISSRSSAATGANEDDHLGVAAA